MSITMQYRTRQVVLLLPAMRAALQDLANESGMTFVLQRGEGQEIVAAEGRGASGVAGGRGSSAVQERSTAAKQIVRLPGGETAALSIRPERECSPEAQDAWIRSAVCLLSSMARMESEADSMAGEIARTYEELTLLHYSSAALSAPEDIPSTCEKAMRLVADNLSCHAAGIYLKDSEDGPFILTAHHGPRAGWRSMVHSDASLPPESDLLSSRPMLREVASAREFASVGIAAENATSLLCAPLWTDGDRQERLLGWLALYRQKGDSPFRSTDAKLASALASQASAAILNARLVEERQALMLGTIRSLASAVDAKDRYTHGHSLRVTTYALAISRQMGFSHSELQAMELAGLLHDVGKIGVPDRVLSKPGPLDEDEWVLIRRHPLIGIQILEKVPALHPFVRHGVRSHHERFDGHGYPDRLAGKDIPLAGRILAIADCFDAMTSDRPYRSGTPAHTAILQMIAASGQQFDPEILAHFLECWSAGMLDEKQA